MAQRCPNGHGTEYVETLLDRFRCLQCGAYFDQSGKEVDGGAVWTSRVPAGHEETAKRDVAAAKAQRKVKK